MKRDSEINLDASFAELFTEADEREAEEILAKPEDEKQRIIDARVAILLKKITQRSRNNPPSP